MSQIWERFPASHSSSELLCMLKFADYANDEGVNIYPSIATMAKQVRLSESQTRRTIHKLISSSWILVIGNVNGGAPGSSRQYQINLSKLKDTPSINATPSTDARGGVDAREGSRTCARGVAPTPANPSLTIKNHKSKISILDEYDFAKWPEQPDEQIFRDWLTMRKTKKAPVTTTVLNRMGAEITKSVDQGFTVDDCLSEAVTRNWQGFNSEWMAKNIAPTNQQHPRQVKELKP